MHVVHLTASTLFGGPERQMLGLGRHLPPQFRSTYGSFPEGGRCEPFLAEARAAGFPTFRLTADTPDVPRAIDELTRLLRDTAADVLVGHTFKPNVLGRLAARRVGIPVVTVSRGWTWESLKVRVYETVDRVNLRLVDHVVAVSNGQADRVRKCGVPPTRLSVIRNAARLAPFAHPDPAFRDRLRGLFPADTPVSHVVLAAGRLSPEKGFDVLVEAAAEVLKQHPAAGFVLFGEGGEQANLEQRVAELGLAARFRMPGHSADLDRFLPWADVAVLPSFTEGLPNVALEASAAGVPVVATAVGGTPEVVADGDTGFLVPSGQPAAIAERVNLLLVDQPLRKQLGTAGRERMRREFSFQAQAERYAELFDRLAGRAVRRAGSLSRPIRISYLIDDLSRAGTESQLLALIRSLDRTRFEPSLVLLNGDGELSRSLEPADCPVLRLGVTRLVGVKAVSAARRLWSFWRAAKPHIAQIYFNDSSYLGVPVAKLAGVRRLVRVRNNLGYWQTRKHRWLGRVIRPAVDAYLTNSELGRDAIRTTERVPAERVAVIENGVDLDLFPAPLVGEGLGVRGSKSTRIGCVANLRAVKNIDGLMRAAKLVLDRHPEVVFEVAGEGEQRPALEALHRELGLGGRFVLRGATADVPAFLRSVDIAVLPSHSEGMSNAVLEYMAAGRAVAATDVGANARLIEHGVCGLIVPPMNEPALAEALCQLIGDPKLATRFGVEARRRVEQDYGRDAMVARFEAFYRRLVQ